MTQLGKIPLAQAGIELRVCLERWEGWHIANICTLSTLPTLSPSLSLPNTQTVLTLGKVPLHSLERGLLQRVAHHLIFQLNQRVASSQYLHCVGWCVCCCYYLCPFPVSTKDICLHKAKHTQKDQQEEQMLKRSIFAILTGLLHSHLPYTINHHKHLSSFMQIYNKMIAQVLVFLYPCDLERTSRSFILE